jgi:UDP-2-acetamido-3-amino-2,3-dideoxy-glucuronate N-acetyltransferase
VSENPAFIHPTAVIDDDVEVGAGTKIWHFVHVSRGARIGKDCVLGQNVYIADEVSLGNGVRVQNNVSLYRGVSVEDEVFLGPSCVFTNVTNPRANVQRKDEFKHTVVHTGASVGANATIVCGHELGAYCLFTAGLGLQLLALCYWVIDIKGYRRWAWPFEVFGVNALALFVGSALMVKIMALIKLPGEDGSRLSSQGWIFRNLFLTWAAPVNASLFYAIAFILVWLFLMWLLYRKAIYIKV